ncbi:sigma-54-dependent transcriptional regulator [Pseudoalteromonas tunicata]|uniref:Sigma-54 dependent DNA-binding response regulator, Fis family protein n=1 Tax=Pseudoalteromonas tunicata D2 TaxID=87626 RepID=A4CE14_9GAMM|nr:sigma-54 dependent transcriptional regulator [Pseudoalteromonas tunicata]ATC96301.1 two-component system, NtrC family, response regulator AlgB [Pseudoalteromonas tunicata]AXT31808.1 sigma-54-dependent Fis family transcriptional regulator [Pseudoalteromonas tunicata]EAR27206.1 sigma-54 dependent DNA-binding response regulator, Fis family protein [Pseudoalteromonas tunicata D2]
MNTILIIDDQADVRMAAVVALNQIGCHCIEAQGPDEALALLKQTSVNLILLDMNFKLDTTSGEEGLRFLQQLKTQQLTIPVVVMTAWASVDVAVKAMQLGAVDFVEKPWNNIRLISIVQQQLKQQQISHDNACLKAMQPENSDEYIAQSPQMMRLLAQAKRAAQTDASILITGENGTGKSLLAHFIHQHSARKNQRFVSVNIGAIAPSLFESELFGHKKGAFTDAKEDRLGRFEIANGGTLFLDEIATLPLELQSKMLRVLESQEFEVLGSSQTQQANVRIIAATNAEIASSIEQGEFRRDLFFRINTIELHIPPLRERPEDIIALSTHLLAIHSQKYQRKGLVFSAQAQMRLTQYEWPGNVRELSHCIERAVIMSDNNEIMASDLSLTPTSTASSAAFPLVPLEELEKQMILKAIAEFDGNVIAAGDFLGLSKSAIYRRIEKHQLDLKDLDN